MPASAFRTGQKKWGNAFWSPLLGRAFNPSFLFDLPAKLSIGILRPVTCRSLCPVPAFIPKILAEGLLRLLRKPARTLPAHLEKGRRAERLAEDWLNRELRWRCRYRNWMDGRGEIDLIGIAPDGQWIFVEVRSRQATALVSGYHTINRTKKKVLYRTIRNFLCRLPDIPPWRFDVVDVAWGADGSHEIRHFAQVSLHG